MSNPIPQAQRWSGHEARSFAVVSGSRIDALFQTEEEASAWAAHMLVVSKTWGGEQRHYSVQELPKLSKLSLTLEDVEEPVNAE